MISELIVIRHGQTPWTISGQHTGTTDLPLTAIGEDQARALAPVLGAITCSAVFVSPLQRARRTCELAGLLGHAQLEPRLREWHYGSFEGLTPAEIRARHPGWDVFRDGGPGGETPDQVGTRVDGLLADLRRLAGRVVLFSHGHLLRALAARWIGLPIAVGRTLLLDAAATGVLTYEHQQAAVPAIALWNADARMLTLRLNAD